MENFQEKTKNKHPCAIYTGQCTSIYKVAEKSMTLFPQLGVWSNPSLVSCIGKVFGQPFNLWKSCLGLWCRQTAWATRDDRSWPLQAGTRTRSTQWPQSNRYLCYRDEGSYPSVTLTLCLLLFRRGCNHCINQILILPSSTKSKKLSKW